ncbi:hypothetical protein PLESTM_000864600 [Pleodorina starrii]|nr:hypothetical protein PLESTM_000864600 [Pleodorina starrii]
MPEVDSDQLMWLEEDGEEENLQQEQPTAQAVQLSTAGVTAESEHGAAIAALEEELHRTRKELMDVRKDLAAKTVQLSRKEVIVSQEKVAELAAHVASEKDKQLASLAAHVEQLELVLGRKEEELEESRRMYNAQKRALREALAAAAEAEAAERQADEARAQTAVAQVVEDELDRLQHELALLQARYDIEMRARDAELQSLRSELQAANTNRKQAVAAAEAALTEAWQEELGRATEEATARVAELEAEVARVRQQLEEQARSGDTVALAGELASLNQQKVAIQREFDAFREMATASSREHREAAARLLEENAALKGRLAARAFQDVQAGFKPQSKVFSALTGPSAAGGSHGGAGSGPGSGSSSSSSSSSSGLQSLRELLAGLGPGSNVSWTEAVPEVLRRLERQRKGLVPALALGGVFVLFLLVAVIRAAAVTRSEHSGGLCFLAHLGINVGPGCAAAQHLAHPHPQTVAEAASEELGQLLDQAPRVHDLEAVAEAVAEKEKAAEEKAEREAAEKEAAEKAAGGGAGEGGAGGGGAAAEATEAGEIGAVDPIIAVAAAQGVEAGVEAKAAKADAGGAATGAAAGAGGDGGGGGAAKEEQKQQKQPEGTQQKQQQQDQQQAAAAAAGTQAAVAGGDVGKGAVGQKAEEAEAEAEADMIAAGEALMEAAGAAARRGGLRLLLQQQQQQGQVQKRWWEGVEGVGRRGSSEGPQSVSRGSQLRRSSRRALRSSLASAAARRAR